MKIGCNYSIEAEQLLNDGEIELDYFKYPALGFQMKLMENLDDFEVFCNALTNKRPVLLHGLYPAPHDLSSPSLQADFNDEIVDKLIEVTKTPGLSLHPALTKIPDEIPFSKVLETIINNAIFVKEKFAHMEFVSIENVDTIRWGDLIKPRVITQLLNETGCSFLLDISHAYYASRALDINFYDYLKLLPLEKINEIHINGWCENDKGLTSHIKIHDEAYQALREVLQYCQPKYITVEYGRSDDPRGSGCPIMSPDKINDDAKNEITEQSTSIREILYR